MAWRDKVRGRWRSLLLTLFPLVAVALIVLFLIRSDPTDRRSLAGFSLILGGAVGNLIDRVFRGEVVDFLDVYVSSTGLAEWLVSRFGTAHWPTFIFPSSYSRRSCDRARLTRASLPTPRAKSASSNSLPPGASG